MNLNQIKGIKTTNYSYGDYIVDIEESESELKAYCRHKYYGIKHLIVGYDRRLNPLTANDFVDVVMANIEEAIERYTHIFL